MSRLKYVRHCLCTALYVYCRGRAVTNVGKTCGPTPCFVLAINTFKLNLSWKNHLSRITKKSNNVLDFLRRNLRQASEETKAQAYFTLVRSNLNYCSTIWSLYQRDQKHQVEMVQRRSARFVTNRYRNTNSVTDMLGYLGWASHETRRSTMLLIVLYKIVHGLIDIPPTDYLTQTNSRTRSAHKYKYKPYSTSTDCFKYSFFPRTIPLWKRLPPAAAEAFLLGIPQEGAV